jgi:hypothetical protein
MVVRVFQQPVKFIVILLEACRRRNDKQGDTGQQD